MKKHITFERVMFYVGLIWVFYSFIVSSSGNCELYLKEKNGNWYVMHEESDTDELGTRHYELTDFGPISETEANEIITECEEHANAWLKSYGTIYWCAYNTNFYYELSLLIFILPLGGMWLVNGLYQEKSKTN